MIYQGSVTLAYYDNLDATLSKQSTWQEALRIYLPQIQLLDLQQSQNADVAFVWNPPKGLLATKPSLKAIISMGQGVDHLLVDNTLPRIPIIRLVDKDMSNAMSHWVILVMLDYLRQGARYRKMQESKQFLQLPQRSIDTVRVGVYGVGAIGSVVASRIAALGFEVYGWSTSKKQTNDFYSLAGKDGLTQILKKVDIHINLLPLTSHTKGLFNTAQFSKMKQGSYFINAGRGQSVIEKDLLNAIDSQHLDGAALDVFKKEPLPSSHRFWSHPKIAVWPHVSAQTNIKTAASQVAQTISNVMQNMPLANQVNRERQY